MKKMMLLCCMLLLAIPSAASAASFSVPPASQWSNLASENGGGGWSGITTTQPRDGNGSIELHGDRTRFVAGQIYSPALNNLGLFSDLVDYTFDFLLSSDSVTSLNPRLTPALRLHIWDPYPIDTSSNRSELVWEGAYNGLYSAAEFEFDQWYNSADFGSNFYRWSPSDGVTEQLGKTLDWWHDSNQYSSDAYIIGLSVGAGSGAGSDYFAFVDNVTLHFTDDTTTSINFEAVPEPSAIAIWSLLGISLGAVVWRRRRRAAA